MDGVVERVKNIATEIEIDYELIVEVYCMLYNALRGSY